MSVQAAITKVHPATDVRALSPAGATSREAADGQARFQPLGHGPRLPSVAPRFDAVAP